MNTYWSLLLLSGVLAVGMTTSARYTDGYEAFWPSILFFNFLLFSWMLLERAAIGIPWSTSFAVWAGIGAAGTVLVDMLFFGGALNGWQWGFFGLFVVGLTGFTLTSIT